MNVNQARRRDDEPLFGVRRRPLLERCGKAELLRRREFFECTAKKMGGPEKNNQKNAVGGQAASPVGGSKREEDIRRKKEKKQPEKSSEQEHDPLSAGVGNRAAETRRREPHREGAFFGEGKGR